MKYKLCFILFISMFTLSGQVNDTTVGAKNSKTLLKEDIYKYVNENLPQFTLSDVEGNRITSEELKGRPTLINLWFTTCAPCIEEIPALNALKKDYGDKINCIAITFQNPNVIKSFLEKKAFDFIHLVNSGEYSETFGFFGYPKTIILDKNLKVVKIEKMMSKDRETGVYNSVEFKDRITSVLNTLF